MNVTEPSDFAPVRSTQFTLLMVIVVCWFGFVPLTHMLTFAPGQGWVDFLPQYGYGAVGGWAVALVYCCLLGSLIYLRWRSGAWRRINLR